MIETLVCDHSNGSYGAILSRGSCITLYFCGRTITRASIHGKRKKATVYFARKSTCARCQFNFSLPKHIFFKFFVACSDLVVFLFFLLLFLCNFLNNKATVTSNVVEFSIARQIKNNLQHISQEQVMIDQFAPLGCRQDKIFLAHAGCSSSFNFSSEMISSVGSPSNSASSCIESCRVTDLRERDGFPKQNEI